MLIKRYEKKFVKNSRAVVLLWLLFSISFPFIIQEDHVYASDATASGSIVNDINKCLGVQPEPPGLVIAKQCNAVAAQEWKIYNDGTIRNQDLCLDVDGGVAVRQKRLSVDVCDNTTSQQWSIERGKRLFVNASAKLCVTMNSSSVQSYSFPVLAACGLGSSQLWSLPKRAQSPAMYEPSDGKTYLGVATHINNLPYFHQITANPSHVAIYNSFTGKDGDFQYQFKRLKNNPELTPMITWNVTFQNEIITSGQRDDYIYAAARSARDYGKPVFVRLNWEMNGFWSPNYDRSGGVSPQQYIASWRYIHTIFKQIAPNVAFVWAPNGGLPKSDAHGVPKLSLDNWYPGDSYCDWIGFSSYPEYSTPAQTALTKPEGLNFIAEYAIRKQKPLMLAEWARGGLGVVPTPDTSTAFDIIFGWVNSYPNTVKALVYFNEANANSHQLDNYPIGAEAYRGYTSDNPRYDLDTVR